LAQGDFILLLNPDMRVGLKTLSRAVAWMKTKPEALVTGFKLTKPSGEIIKQVRSFPRLFDQLAIVLKLPHLLPGIVNNYILSDFNYDQDAQVDSIRGSFFMMRRKALEQVGFLDERFFVWFEEVDYCQRVWRAGGQVWYSQSAEAIDYIGQSFKLLDRSVAQKYFRDSMLKYFAKWRPAHERLILRLAWMISDQAVKLLNNKNRSS
jgi:GT2 family glycosyltransferase